MDWISLFFCGSKTYAVQVAKMLDADWKCISQSGWGLCWGWDGDVTSSIPLHYEQVCSVLNSDYQIAMGSCDPLPKKGGADYVILNLGTNDNSGFKSQDDGKGADGVAGKAIVAEAKRFLGVIRKYNPEAKIVWTWGMIPIDVVPALIQKGIDEYKKESGDKNVYALGGMNIDNIKMAKDLGFGGVVISGDIWNRFDIHNQQDFIEVINHFKKLRKAIG